MLFALEKNVENAKFIARKGVNSFSEKSFLFAFEIYDFQAFIWRLKEPLGK